MGDKAEDLSKYYTKEEMKQVVKNGVFGKDAKIVGMEKVGRGSTERTKITIKYPDGSDRVVNIRTQTIGDQIYFKIKSVDFYSKSKTSIQPDYSDFLN